MATTMSQASSLAPTDFRICSSLEESHGALSVAVEHCQLCTGARKPFYCTNCVRKGNFSHSREKTNERYSEKLQKWHTLKKERLKLLERIQSSVKKKHEIDAKNNEVLLARENLAVLQRTITQKKAQVEAEKENFAKLKEQMSSREVKARRHEEKKRRICRYIKQTEQHIDHRVTELKSIHEQLCQKRTDHVAALVRYIFPVTELQPKSDSTDSLAMSTVSALAEARRTSYIRGRWVYTDNGGEHQYQIVEPSLPGNGDYSAYSVWLLENRDSVLGPDSELNQRNPAYTISAALSYTTQLLSLLAHFLHVNLPHRLCYSEFCGMQLSEKQLNRAVNRLNRNILHLCFTQNVNPEMLHPRHTIHNLLVLLRCTQLGREGPFSINPDLLQSVEDSQQSTDSDLELTTSSEDEADGGEWERVPVTLPEVDVPTRTCDSYMSTTHVQSRAGRLGAQTDTTGSMAGGLMSSAAASVASLWRAATGRRGSAN